MGLGQLLEVIELGIQQVGGRDFLKRREHSVNSPGKFFRPLGQHLLEDLALQVFLRAAKVARDYRERSELGKFSDIGLFTISHRSYHDMLTVI